MGLEPTTFCVLLPLYMYFACLATLGPGRITKYPLYMYLYVLLQVGSPQLAPAPKKDKEPEKENEPKMLTMNVAGTEVPLREKMLKKSLSNTSTGGGDSKQLSLSMFDNRTKVMHMCM